MLFKVQNLFNNNSHVNHEVTKLAILKKCNTAQKCIVLFLSVSTKYVKDSAPFLCLKMSLIFLVYLISFEVFLTILDNDSLTTA